MGMLGGLEGGISNVVGGGGIGGISFGKTRGQVDKLINNNAFGWTLYGNGQADNAGQNVADQSKNMSVLSDQLKQQADAQWAKYQNLYGPVEQKYINDANTIDSQENQNRVAGEAGAQVRDSYAKTRAATARDMASLGIDPNSGRYADVKKQLDMNEAATEALGMNAAREGLKATGINMRAGVVQQGNTVANSSMLGDQTALSGYKGSGDLTIGETNANTNAFNANTTNNAGRAAQAQSSVNSILGSISGMGGFGSSKKIKTDKKAVSDSATLEAIKSIPVGSWKYKNGEGDGGAHIGPYAEDVNAKFGDSAAPGGKSIDIISALGINMSAIRGVAKQVDKLSAKVDALQGA